MRSSDASGQYGPGHNCFTTTPDGKTDILVYHARSFREIEGNSLANPDRAVRAQVLRWKPDGTPDFGSPVPDGPYSGLGDATQQVKDP
jgi:GH43 family beta-xylosidase